MTAPLKLTNPTDDALRLAVAAHVAGIRVVRYEEWDAEKRFPYYIPSGKPWRTHRIDSLPLPDFTRSADAVLPWLDKMKWRRKENGSILCWNVGAEVCSSESGIGFNFSKAACIALLRAHGAQVEFSA